MASGSSCDERAARRARAERPGGAAAAQLVERGVAGDPEQPRARPAAGRTSALAVRALERLAITSSAARPVADQRRDVREDVPASPGTGRRSLARRWRWFERSMLTSVLRRCPARPSHAMRRLPRCSSLLVPLALTAAPALDESPHLWATVNICDTAQSPDTIGSARRCRRGKGRRLLMRFRVQYSRVDGVAQLHVRAPTRAASPSAPGALQGAQSGWTFPFRSPASVHRPARRRSFQWRRGGEVVRRAAESARAATGPPSTPRATPRATCEISRANSRGSFVMTPVTPRRSSRAMRRPSSTVHT